MVHGATHLALAAGTARGIEHDLRLSSGQVGVVEVGVVGSDAAEPTASEWVLYPPKLGRSGLHASVRARGCSDLVAAHFALLFLICHAFLPRVRRRQ